MIQDLFSDVIMTLILNGFHILSLHHFEKHSFYATCHRWVPSQKPVIRRAYRVMISSLLSDETTSITQFPCIVDVQIIAERMFKLNNKYILD